MSKTTRTGIEILANTIGRSKNKLKDSFGNLTKRRGFNLKAESVFTRLKIISAIFAHAEYEIANQAFVLADGLKLYTDRIQQNNVYVGGGYSSGQGNTRFEIVALYNLQTPESTLYYISPFTFRFGFTVNF